MLDIHLAVALATYCLSLKHAAVTLTLGAVTKLIGISSATSRWDYRLTVRHAQLGQSYVDLTRSVTLAGLPTMAAWSGTYPKDMRMVFDKSENSHIVIASARKLSLAGSAR